jgi:hypothetical protein
MTKAENNTQNPMSEEDRALLASLLNQLNGVLICTLAACEGRSSVPDAFQGAIFAAAQIAGKARQMI